MMLEKIIIMLTHNDKTVPDAIEIFDENKDLPIQYWGFKDVGMEPAKMKILCDKMHEAGKTAFLEVVSYSEEECMRGAKLAVDCGFDYLLGTLYYDSVAAYIKEHGLKYCPFAGKVSQSPSILEGTVEEMLAQEAKFAENGVYGTDLLGYRYVGDAVELNRRFVAETPAPVVLAGSVNSYQRLDEVKAANPWAFTIGGAFFENKFDGTFAEQIDKVVDYINK